MRTWESSWIVGILQTPDYARARIGRQELLHSGGRRYHIILWEPVLRSLLCPPSGAAAQLDRLTGVIGMDTVDLGILPLTAFPEGAARPRLLNLGRPPGRHRDLARGTAAR
ncbi:MULTISPECIES: Scr1 family TA system antitoxin-like transcriptional regulator [unclassified Streptomyces]|uniref:Scr1 family TA system antitoxin-like transcriptional regulator n=1 Tax=unclassified Streptomyces TaxID=2593676 RepID=UPI002E2B2FCD|nr:Scr1 family TA system antitoxin-like transcriptional regulator [Streptomyces sp. NBC_00342]